MAARAPSGTCAILSAEIAVAPTARRELVLQWYAHAGLILLASNCYNTIVTCNAIPTCAGRNLACRGLNGLPCMTRCAATTAAGMGTHRWKLANEVLVQIVLCARGSQNKFLDRATGP